MNDYPALTAVLWVLGYLYLFWIAYIVVMGLYRAHLQKRLSNMAKVLAAPVIAIGVAMDVIAQYTLATVVFVEFPPLREPLVTIRLGRYIRGNYGWRSKLANWVCTNLLDVFDPSGYHC